MPVSVGTTNYITAGNFDSHNGGSPLGFAAVGFSLKSQLTAALGTADTTMTVADNTGWNTRGYLAVGTGNGDTELVGYTGLSGTTGITGLTRGVQGSTARTHALGSIVAQVVTPENLNDHSAAIVALELNVPRLLAYYEVGSATAPIPLTIPTGYRNLKFDVLARGANASAIVNVTLQLNADTGANYDYEYEQATAGGIAAQEVFGATSIRLGSIAAASAAAGLFGSIVGEIPAYNNVSANKVVRSQSGYKSGTATGNMTLEHGIGFWRNSAAVGQIQFNTTGNFAVGSAFYVYGYP